MNASVPSSAAAPTAETAERGPSSRTWWEATRETLTHPAQWTRWHFALLVFLAVVVVGALIWLTRPGRPLGGPAPLSAGEVYINDATGQYIYTLYEPPADLKRVTATLQAIYNRHKAASSQHPLHVVLLAPSAPADAYILGTGDPNGPNVIGTVTVDGSTRQAQARSSAQGPLQPVQIRW